VIQLGVKECLLPDDGNDPDLQRLVKVIDSCGVIQTLRKKSEFNSGSVEQDLNRLLNEENAGATLPEFSKKIAMGSMSVLMSYLGLLHDDTNFGQYAISTHDLSQFLRLDASAVRALSLFSEPGASRSMSVFGLLNRCKTSQGTRLLGQWLKQPLVNLHEINRRHDLVEIFVEDSMARQTLQSEYLRLMPDLRRISKKFQKQVASLEDVVRVYQAVLRLGDLIEVITSADTPSERHGKVLQEAFGTPIKTSNTNLAMFVEMVEATLDLSELENHNFVIKPDFDEKLRTIKDSLDQVRDQIDEQHRLAGKDLKLDIEKKLHLENHSTYGYCLRVTRTEANAIKGKRGYTDIATIKGGVYFTTSALKELDEEFRTLSDQYSTTQSKLVQDVIGIAATYCSPLDQLNIKLAELDVIVAFAHVSANAPEPYTRPDLVEMGGERRGDLKVVAARHPVLEVQEDISFIANDVEMVHDKSEFLVITGPNMGGKSTFIRQVGILALMAQAGCFVPASQGAQLPIFDCILARVGAGDSQVKGVSTFMQEMLELAQILKTATPDSLVLIDELGRGTSTYDGFGIAYAASEWIATKVRCKTLFASHFAEITSLAEQVPHVRNLHVVAHVTQRRGGGKQDRDITLLYQVKEGISDRSYGIHVAELAGFPESVIRLAKRKAEELEDYQEEDEEEEGVDSGDGAAAAARAAAKLDLPKEVTDAGTALVEEFLQTWAERTSALAAAQPEDAVMQEGGEGEGAVSRKRARLDASVELAELRKVTEEDRERIESNPWAKQVLATF
jgi:DNA mismatch repair protein MSH2